ncbi:hypothetical protein FPV67DRAFT_1468364 [Lyophyllum atratum]|nr:hypothetical protein FPV67DRAFT_1468364 [Lyophyllum atratum]
MECLQNLPFRLAAEDFVSYNPYRLVEHTYHNHAYIHVLKQLRHVSGRRSRQKTWELGILLIHLAPEIFYQILGYLHPLDLYHMSHANKQLRALIHSPSYKLWDLAFERNPTMPSCPLGMPPLKWLGLLFGPAKCQRCYITMRFRANVWRRRLCYPCSRKWAEEVVTALERVSVEAGTEREGSSATNYDATSHEDVQNVADMVGAWGIIHVSYWDSADCSEIVALKTEPATKDIVASLVASREEHQMWLDNIDKEVTTESEARGNVIVEMLSNRLRKDGYEAQAVQQFNDKVPKHLIQDLFERRHPKNHMITLSRLKSRSLKATKQFIRQNWAAGLKAGSERLLYSIARPRIRGLLRAERGDAIRRIWDEYVTSLDAAHRCAEVPDILLNEPFMTMVDSPSDDSIHDDEIVKVLDRFADRWLPRSMEDLFADPPSQLFLDDRSPSCIPHAYSINSAVSVFSCQDCKHMSTFGDGCELIGWSVASAHTANCPSSSFGLFDLAPVGPPLKVSEVGCVAALSLLDLLGLDPHTTVADDMDKRDARFTCVKCTETDGYRVPLSWRECVSHFIDLGGQQSHMTPSWKVIPHEEVSVSPGV